MITTLIVSLGSLIFSVTASGEWKPRPTGYVLEEPSIVGSVEDGRVMVEKTKGLEARVDATDEALERIEAQVKVISSALAEAQGQVAQVPDLIKQVEADFAKTLRKEKAKSTATGLTIGLIFGIGGALLF